MKHMPFLPDELRERLPALYATEQTPDLDKIIQASYFMPDSFWYWYPIEFDGTDTCFGLVAGYVVEFGYFQLSELEAIRGPWGLFVERDVGFDPTAVRDILHRHRNRLGADELMGIA